MHDKEDFFSPEMVDERLELSLLQHEADTPDHDLAGTDPDLLLISDLRYLYGAEGTENVRSLQRVWEHLKEQHAKKETNPVSPLPEVGSERRLRLLKPSDVNIGREIRRRSKRAPGRALAALAAVLFMMVMVGSLLAIVHLTRGGSTNGSAQATASSKSTAAAQPTPIPGYLYPPPGNDIAVSPSSSDTFYALAWSPDGKQLATSTEGKIWIWDAVSNQYRTLIDAQLAGGGSVKALAWSPDGNYLAVGSNPIQVVNTLSGQVLSNYSADYPYLPVPGQTTLVTALAWSPDGSMLAVATQHSDGTCLVFVWDIQKGTGIYTFRGQGSASGISSVSWSGDNYSIASSDGQTVQAWNARNGGIIFQQKLDAATNVAWSPGGGLLAFVNQHATQIWNVWQGNNNQGKLVSSYPATNGVLSWSPKGQYLATANGNTVIIFEPSSGIRIYTYTGDTHPVYALAWSPDGNSIATGESGSSGRNFARIWSA